MKWGDATTEDTAIDVAVLIKKVATLEERLHDEDGDGDGDDIDDIRKKIQKLEEISMKLKYLIWDTMAPSGRA